ncbi:MAG: hypothetical protein CMJ83_00710 [Planctomycetes bacterium]|nr:hypothetical protein [Planctomycetota bacterium]
MLIGGAVVAVAAVIGLIVIISSGDDERPKQTSNRNAKAEARKKLLAESTDAAMKFLGDVSKRHDVQTAAGAWEASKELFARVETMRAEKKLQEPINLLLKEASTFKKKVLQFDPDFGPAREANGERKYADDLVPYMKADYLEEADKVVARRAHARMLRYIKGSKGWAQKDKFADVDKIIARLKPTKDKRDKLRDTPFYRTALQMEQKILADLENRFRDYEKDGKWTGAEMRIREPFVFFIQKDVSWDTQQVANTRSRSLLGLQDIILSEFGKEIDIKPVKEPVPVLMFRTHGMYQKYAGSGPGVLAHFEPSTGRLAVHDDCDHTTIMHEGTHQLMWFWTTRDGATNTNPGLRSYWFQEGVAEWYSGSHRTRNSDGQWAYDIGLLHAGRLSNLSALMGTAKDAKKLFNLKELVKCRYMHRGRITKTGRTGALYAQGWFLIYFMNHFNVDDQGVVHPEQTGKYAARWREYVKAELQGETGIDVFMEKMQLDEESFKKLSDEHWRFAAWVNTKMNLKAVKDKRIIPWKEQKNRRGETSGEAKDDILTPLAGLEIPPWDRDSIKKPGEKKSN